MIVVDSSGWIEFFTDGPLAGEYGRRLKAPHHVVTPTIVVYEVYKRLKRDQSEEDAMIAAGAMQRTRIVPLDEELALTAADLSLAHGLAMADAIVLATARRFAAGLVTSEADFQNIDDVTYLAKKL